MNEQEAYLRKIGTYPSLDELALEFDDAFRAYLGNLREKKCSQKTDVLLLLKEMDSLFDIMSSQESSNWDIKDIDNDNWYRIRILSKEILTLL